MHITTHRANRTLTIALAGKLDVTTAPLLQEAMQLEDAETLILDLEHCSFISSAGLRGLLVAQKLMAGRQGVVQAINVSPDVLRILEITGMSTMMTVKPKARAIALEGLEFLSAGVCGECFRLDRETIVKLYKEGIDPQVAEQEKRFAKAAFVLGIPTAISYDVVTCGTRTGVVYEMLDAELFSKVIIREPQHLDRHAQTLAGIARTVNSIKGDPALLPDLKRRFRGYIDQMGSFLSTEDVAYLQRRLDMVPDAETCVHFDLHSSNIMIRDGEPVIIDMGDLSIGSYLFDMGLLYTIYGLPEVGLSPRATGIPTEMGVALWEGVVSHYFADKPAADREWFERNRYFLGSLRLIYSVTFLPQLRDQLMVWIRDILLPRMKEESPEQVAGY